MRVLRDGRFLRFLAGQTLGGMAGTALYLSLAIWVKDLTGSNARAGLLFLALGLPVIGALFLGHLVDRVGRRRLLVTTYTIGAIGVLSLLTVRSAAGLWLIYAAAVGYGAVSILAAAAQAALVKDIVSASSLDVANAALNGADQGLRVISPLIGAGIFVRFGPHALIIIVALAFAIAAVSLVTIPAVETVGRAGGTPGPTKEKPLREALVGLWHIRATPVLARISAAIAVAFCVLGFFESVDFAVINRGLHQTPAYFGVLAAVQGAGSVAGAVVAVGVLRRLGEVRTVGLALDLDGVGALGLTQHHAAAVLGGTAVMGIGVSWFLIAGATARQRYSPARLQGRVAAGATLLTWIPQTVSIGVGAALIGVVDYRVLVLIVTIVVGGAGTFLLASPGPLPEPITSVTAKKARDGGSMEPSLDEPGDTV